jgi:hypothetical protein
MATGTWIQVSTNIAVSKLDINVAYATTVSHSVLECKRAAHQSGFREHTGDAEILAALRNHVLVNMGGKLDFAAQNFSGRGPRAGHWR